MHVDPRDKRWSKLVRWLANEHKILAETLGRKPTNAEHRAHAHAFIDWCSMTRRRYWPMRPQERQRRQQRRLFLLCHHPLNDDSAAQQIAVVSSRTPSAAARAAVRDAGGRP